MNPLEMIQAVLDRAEEFAGDAREELAVHARSSALRLAAALQANEPGIDRLLVHERNALALHVGVLAAEAGDQADREKLGILVGAVLGAAEMLAAMARA